jgi:5'-deoxynucleotidase YfbR-like HD superfamily hydrolase
MIPLLNDAPKGCIRTNSGLYINVFNPTPEMICIEDIAHAEAAMPRFAGHLDKRYSVAQHSLMAAQLASPKNRKAALLHDATEAYMLDMPTPIKNQLPEYKAAEDNLMLVIAEKFGFEFPFDPEIKQIDKYLVNLEWEKLVRNPDKDFKCLTAIQAKKEFLRVYHEIIAAEQSGKAFR